MFAMGGLLSIIQAGGVLLMPPSPRYYVLHGKYAEVRPVRWWPTDVHLVQHVQFSSIRVFNTLYSGY